MPKFEDMGGGVWTIPPLTVNDLKRVRAATGVRFADLTDDGFGAMEAFLRDDERFTDVLFALVEPAAVRAGVTAEQFGGLMGGGALEKAKLAFVESYADFYPSRGPLLRALAATNAEAVGRLVTEAVEQLSGLTPNGSATILPASSASTPAP